MIAYLVHVYTRAFLIQSRNRIQIRLIEYPLSDVQKIMQYWIEYLHFKVVAYRIRFITACNKMSNFTNL